MSHRPLPVALLALACAALAASVAAADGGSWLVLPRPLAPEADATFSLLVARGERGAEEAPLASLGDAALQVLWNDGRLWMPADVEPLVRPDGPGLHLVGVAPSPPDAGRRYAKCFVPVGRPRDGRQLWRSRLGHRLELVPAVDPLATRAGGALPLVVFFEGEPLAGAIVSALPRGGSLREYRRGTTDATGATTLELGGASWWMVHVMHKTRGGEIVGASLALPPTAGD